MHRVTPSPLFYVKLLKMEDSMETKVLLPTEENIAYAASLIGSGGVVGLPTETVYGLAASAFDESAVEKIFIAKGRPQDNPLIVHIASLAMLDTAAASVPDVAKRLAERFWPGPLTMIFEKSDRVPPAVTAGLSTVAVRFPSHKVAQALIEKTGLPLAAPSANRSGEPSPTTANHVYNDLNGRIPAILDGGSCTYGLESTVILLKGENDITLLRPGAVTVEMLRETVPNVTVDDGVLHEVRSGEKALSPGMLHKHYSPKTNVIILDAPLEPFLAFVNSHADRSVGAMVFEGEEAGLKTPYVTFGSANDPMAQARLLFSSLRAVDELGVETIYARMPAQDGMGLAIYNRLLRAAGFEVIRL